MQNTSRNFLSKKTCSFLVGAVFLAVGLPLQAEDNGDLEKLEILMVIGAVSKSSDARSIRDDDSEKVAGMALDLLPEIEVAKKDSPRY